MVHVLPVARPSPNRKQPAEEERAAATEDEQMYQTSVSQCGSSENKRQILFPLQFQKAGFHSLTESRAEFDRRKAQIAGCRSHNLLEQGRLKRHFLQ